MPARKNSFRPILGNIAVAPDPPPSMLTEGGLIKADFAIHNLRKDEKQIVRRQRAEATTGYIVSMGNGAFDKHGKRIPFGVKVGDHVMFKAYAGHQFFMDGDVFLLMFEHELLGWVVDEAAPAPAAEERKTA